LPLRNAPFQSTPSGGKATNADASVARASRFQSTPSGGKATRLTRWHCREIIVSIHAFRGEGDGPRRGTPMITTMFQSTPSGGKATG